MDWSTKRSTAAWPSIPDVLPPRRTPAETISLTSTYSCELSEFVDKTLSRSCKKQFTDSPREPTLPSVEFSGAHHLATLLDGPPAIAPVPTGLCVYARAELVRRRGGRFAARGVSPAGGRHAGRPGVRRGSRRGASARLCSRLHAAAGAAAAGGERRRRRRGGCAGRRRARRPSRGWVERCSTSEPHEIGGHMGRAHYAAGLRGVETGAPSSPKEQPALPYPPGCLARRQNPYRVEGEMKCHNDKSNDTLYANPTRPMPPLPIGLTWHASLCNSSARCPSV
jgi:hypothetical protein